MKKNKKKKTTRNSPRTLNRILIPGTLSVHPKKRFGFVSPDHPEEYNFDIFVAYRDFKGALDGDHVIVSLLPKSRYGDKYQGIIHEVTSRGKTILTGIITALIDKTTAWVVVNILNPEIPVKAKLLPKYTYRVGDRLLLKTPEWKAESVSKEADALQMTTHIGNIDDASSDFLTIQAEFALENAFPEAVIQESKQFSQQHILKSLHSRTDLRDLLCFTIDSATAKDFDDAVSLTYDHHDNCILGVHIADVSHYVVPNSALDKEASKRCNSTYFPNRVIPMLPPVLSDDICSLKPHVDRLAVSVFMTFSKDGYLTNYQIHRSVIQSKYRMTYDEVDEILERKKKHPLSASLLAMYKLSKKFIELREKRGCIPLVLSSLSMSLDKNDEPIKLVETKQTPAHRLIEEFMLKANEIIAYHISHQEIPLPFRIHEPPNEESLLTFQETAKSMGFSIPFTTTHEPDYQCFLEKIPNHHPLKPVIHSQFVRSMKTASYSTENKGHYGLKLDYYTHFTSPIRRYIDLIVHRILFHPMSVEAVHLEHIVRQCSCQERISAKAEFAFENIKKTRFLAKVLKEHPETIYSAYITAPSVEGIAFVIPELCLEGFITQAQLPKHYALTKKTAYEDLPKHMQPGTLLKLNIKAVNLLNQTIEWGLITPSKEEKRPQKKKTEKSNSLFIKKKQSLAKKENPLEKRKKQRRKRQK